MTVTMREKGKALEDGGGMVMTSDIWLGPEIPAMKELAEFERRYWKAIAPERPAMSAEQMAAGPRDVPDGQAGDRTPQAGRRRSSKARRSMTTTTFEAVKRKEQLERRRSPAGGQRRRPRRDAGAQDDEERTPTSRARTIFTVNTRNARSRDDRRGRRTSRSRPGFKEKK